MKAGFIGLGRMGQGMARNLRKAGVELVVHDLDAKAVQSLVEAGAIAAPSAADVARQVPVVFLSLPGPPQVEAVVLGEGGVLQGAAPGLAIFDLSTSSRSTTLALHEACAKKGVSFMDAPISGGPAGAASGNLAIWVGGERAVYDRHAGLLDSFSNAHRHVGAVGSGNVVKLAHNMLGQLLLLSMAEVFTVGVKAGVEPLELWESLRLGLVGKQSPLFMLVDQFLPGQFEKPAMTLKLAHKDMSLANQLAKEVGVPVRLASMTLEEVTEALARGFGEQDTRSFLKLQIERAGVKIAVEPERLKKAVEAARR